MKDQMRFTSVHAKIVAPTTQKTVNKPNAKASYSGEHRPDNAFIVSGFLR